MTGYDQNFRSKFRPPFKIRILIRLTEFSGQKKISKIFENFSNFFFRKFQKIQKKIWQTAPGHMVGLRPIICFSKYAADEGAWPEKNFFSKNISGGARAHFVQK